MCDLQTSASLLLSFSTLDLCWLNRMVLRLYESFKNSCIFAMKSGQSENSVASNKPMHTVLLI